MRPTRVLLAISAAALLAAACGDDTSGSGAPAAAGSSSASATASPSAAGGGLASLTATEILTKAKAAFQKAESVRLKGGGADGSETFKLDMAYGPDKAIGTVSSNGQVVELRRIGQVVYLKADAKFWTDSGAGAAASVLGGKYLKAPLTDKKVAQLASFTDKDSFVGQVLDNSSALTKGEAKDVRGTPTIGLVDKDTSGGGTLYVATSGEPLPLQLTPNAGGGDTGTLDFLDYDKAVTVEVPPAAQTIDVTKLGK